MAALRRAAGRPKPPLSCGAEHAATSPRGAYFGRTRASSSSRASFAKYFVPFRFVVCYVCSLPLIRFVLCFRTLVRADFLANPCDFLATPSWAGRVGVAARRVWRYVFFGRQRFRDRPAFPPALNFVRIFFSQGEGGRAFCPALFFLSFFAENVWWAALQFRLQRPYEWIMRVVEVPGGFSGSLRANEPVNVPRD